MGKEQKDEFMKYLKKGITVGMLATGTVLALSGCGNTVKEPIGEKQTTNEYDDDIKIQNEKLEQCKSRLEELKIKLENGELDKSDFENEFIKAIQLIDAIGMGIDIEDANYLIPQMSNGRATGYTLPSHLQEAALERSGASEDKVKAMYLQSMINECNDFYGLDLYNDYENGTISLEEAIEKLNEIVSQKIVREALPDFENMSEQETVKYIKALFITAHNKEIEKMTFAGKEMKYDMDHINLRYSSKNGEITAYSNTDRGSETMQEYIQIDRIDEAQEYLENQGDEGRKKLAFVSCAQILDIYYKTEKVPEELVQKFKDEYEITNGELKETIGDELKEIDEDKGDER